MRAAVAIVLVSLAGTLRAEDPDTAALSLPGSGPQAVESARSWRLFVEGAGGHSVVRDVALTEETRSTQRISVDLQIDATAAPALRAVVADRLDIDWQDQFERRHEVNTLKEAYLSWQPRNDLIVDAGRVNQYAGVAIGYNPTDFFRGGALRSPVSVDPTRIKKDRQGSVMLRGQLLWEGGSLTALYSPALSDHPRSSAFDPDWGATNRIDRGQLIYSTQLAEELNPQWLLYLERGSSPQFGMNLTRLINNATVAYFEWSGGRTPSLLAQALGQEGDEAFRHRVASGLTYTTSNKLSLTFEYQYNGTGLPKSEWDALPWVSPQDYLPLREFAQRAQEMPTRHAAFFYATWQDLLIPHLDWAAMIRYDWEDHSRLSWLELRYRWTHDEIALQWQNNSGELFSDYGASPLRDWWELSYRHYL